MSTLRNIFTGKCPHCGQAEVFKDPNPYNLVHMADIHTRCPHCNKSFQREPGFYFGAMYVSYAITSGIAIASMVLFWWILGLTVVPLVSIIASIILLTFPLIFRISRMIWLSWFIGGEE